MQTLTITGYLSRDAEQANTRNGDAVTRWNVPVKQGWGENERTNWYRISIWGKRADFAAKARKGEFVTVTGDLTIGEYDGKPQYEIRANDFQNVRTAPREADGSQGAPSQTRKPATVDVADDLDDDIPFVTRDGIW
jgi:single-strand DNA-binding protein